MKPHMTDGVDTRLKQYQSSIFVAWFLITLLAVVVMIRGQQFYYSTTVLIFMAVVVLAWWRRTALLLLLLIQVYLFVLEPKNEPNLFSMFLFPALALISLLQGWQFETALSLPTLYQQPSLEKKTLLERFRELRERIAGGLNATAPDFAHLLRKCCVAIAAVFLAGWLLSFFPLNYNSRREYRLLPEGLRVISLSIVLALIFFLTRALLTEWSWRRLSVSQASVYLRGFLGGWLNEDWALLRKLRKKEAQRKAAQKQNESKAKVK